MPEQHSHRYTETLAFERLMLLIATILKNPGIGSPDDLDSSGENHNALDAVTTALQQLAKELHINLPTDYPATPTLRKDLETLRKYGILERRMYRWGYYLGTGALSIAELKVAFDAIASQAKNQGDAQVRRIYENLQKRLRGLNIELKGEFFYPTRQHLNRAIIYTDPEEMAQKGKNRDTLFHQLPRLEQAISQRQAIEISRSRDYYGSNNIGRFQVFPLQLIYHDIAWYLLYENCENGHLVIGRCDRFSNHCELVNLPARDLEQQKTSLDNAYKLLENGWGLNLGNLKSQQAELAGTIKFIPVKVRFFPPVSAFILEAERRHKHQKVIIGEIDQTTGHPHHVEYSVDLPERSLNEFMFWVNRYLENAKILSPIQLVEKHHQAVKALLSRYS